jgi:hypothetical protein
MKYIPIFNILREPGRFDLIASIAFAIMAAYGANEVFKIIKASGKVLNMRFAVFAIISLILLIETAMPPLSNSLISQMVTNINVSNFYIELGQQSGNFSVLELPIIPNYYSTKSELYPGKAMFTTIFSHKPIIGGYLTRENTTEQLSVYNIPLTIQTFNLQVSDNMSYQSPVNQNVTNVTLFTLYNYGTEFVSVEKSAFTSQQLLNLELYLFNTFGRPVYNDNSTVAFNTQAAISNSVYRSFVAYPMITLWSSVRLTLNGTTKILWVPTNPGPIIVYAPYSNLTNIQSALTLPTPEYINATLRFDAISPSMNSVLYIGGLTPQNQFYTIATVNTTPTLKSYSVPLRLVSGPFGNNIFFLTSNSSTNSTGLSNITFSRRT